MVSDSEEKELEFRNEVVDLCRKHVEECKTLERSGHKGGNSAFFSEDNPSDKPLITELPDIDGDEGFQLLRRNDKKIVSSSSCSTIIIIMIYDTISYEYIYIYLIGLPGSDIDVGNPFLNPDLLFFFFCCSYFIIDII